MNFNLGFWGFLVLIADIYAVLRILKSDASDGRTALAARRCGLRSLSCCRFSASFSGT